MITEEQYLNILDMVFELQIRCLQGKATESYADDKLKHEVLLDILFYLRKVANSDLIYYSNADKYDDILAAIKVYVLPEELALKVYQANH